jgi:hypothetical protein
LIKRLTFRGKSSGRSFHSLFNQGIVQYSIKFRHVVSFHHLCLAVNLRCFA